MIKIWAVSLQLSGALLLLLWSIKGATYESIKDKYFPGSNIASRDENNKCTLEKKRLRQIAKMINSRDIWGNALEYRSIQLGLRGAAVKEYVNNWILSIKDITEYVKELDKLRIEGIDIMDRLPQEKVYAVEERE